MIKEDDKLEDIEGCLLQKTCFVDSLPVFEVIFGYFDIPNISLYRYIYFSLI